MALTLKQQNIIKGLLETAGILDDRLSEAQDLIAQFPYAGVPAEDDLAEVQADHVELADLGKLKTRYEEMLAWWNGAANGEARREILKKAKW